MATRDLLSNIRVQTSLTPAVYNTDQNGTSADTAGFESVLIVVHVGNSADTLNATNTIALELEESDDNSTFTDVADADMRGENGAAAGGQWNLINAAAEDTAVFVVGYTGTSRYVRPVVNFAGTHTTGTPIGATVVLSHVDDRPVTVQQANRL